MRKKCLFLAVVMLTIVMGAARSFAAAPELHQVARGVYALVGGDGAANSGFVVTEEGVVVIDTQGPGELSRPLRDKIRETTASPVVYVVNTHYHGDHSFGNQHFREGIIIAHENTRRDLVERDETHRTMFRKFFGEESLRDLSLTLPDLTFTDRLALTLGDTVIEIIYAGGKAHTEGDIFVWLPAQKVLFAGDLLYKGRLPLLNDGDTEGAIASIGAVMETGAKVFVPGHGGIATREDASGYRRYLERLRAEVGRMMGEGMGLKEIKARIGLPEYRSWDKYDEWLPANAEKVYKEISGEER